MGPAAAWAVPAGLSIVGSIIGSNQQNHAQQQAQQAATQATAGQNQLDDATVQLLNNLYADYQKNYQPLEGPVGQQMGGYLSQSNQYGTQSMDALMQALTSPQGRDAFTGVPLQQVQGNTLDYFSNPGQTLSGLGGVGGTALSQLLNPNTNFSQAGGAAANYYGNPQNTALSQLTGGAIGALNPNNMNQTTAAQRGRSTLQGIGRNLADAAGYAGSQIDGARAQEGQYGATQAGIDPSKMTQTGQAQNVYNTLDQAQGYNRAAGMNAYTGLDPSQMVGGRNAVGGDTLNYFQNEMRNGLDPAARGAAMNEAQNANSREISSLRQLMGANTPNIQGSMSDLAERAFSSNANLASSLAGQDQGLRTQGAQGAFGTAQGMDAATAQRLMEQYGIAGQAIDRSAGLAGQGFNTAQGVDQSTMQRLLSQFQNSGTLDAQSIQRALAGNSVASGLGSQQAGLVGQNFGMQSGVDAATGQRIGQQLGAAAGYDQQTAGMYGAGANLGQQMDAQTYQRLAQAMQTAGGMDSQTQQMLMQALGIAGNASQQDIGNLTQASGTGMDLMTMLQNYIGQGRNMIPGVASGLQNIAGQYGAAGAAAANNARSAGQAAAANNPFSALGSAYAGYQAAQPQTTAVPSGFAGYTAGLQAGTGGQGLLGGNYLPTPYTPPPFTPLP